MRRIDAIVTGRRTYEVVLGFGSWPYEVPVYVLSSAHSDDTRVQFVKGGARAAVQAAEANGHQRLYVDGGKTIQGFLEADLIDEMIITTIPIVLGSGVPLFASSAPSRQFSMDSVRQLGPFIQSHFTRQRKP
jgi:dihydrofolate reductase